mgnify:CR=1 FL=1
MVAGRTSKRPLEKRKKIAQRRKVSREMVAAGCAALFSELPLVVENLSPAAERQIVIAVYEAMRKA